MDKLDKLLANVFSTERPIAFFPVRHHSPACSYHVQRAIEMYKPECILIEAPSDTDTLIPYLRDSEPPIAIYYSYQKDKKRNACYYPLQSFSPELVAVKTALAADIPVHFIDLPLGNITLEEEKIVQKEASQDKKTWYDDYFLQRSKYIQTLCEKENCRGHGELWEKLFEISARSVPTEMFIKNLLTFCYFARVDYPEQLLLEENDAIREMYMAENIIKHQKKFNRILAVTGGFHTAALMELTESKKVKKIKPLSGNAYLIPYSNEESDQLTGYASGMPYPGYYQDVYDNLKKGENNFFYKTTLVYITKLAKILRKNRENISISEETAAFNMGLGLADMREKEQPGVYELIDGVQSAFIKGELNMSTSFVIESATRLLRGEKIGKVGKDAPVPPIVLDFTNIATSFRMNISSTIPKTITLEIVSKPRHREQSVFLHRLDFLNNPYAKKTFGPDYKKRINTKLIREKWNYIFSGNVVSALIEKSHYGGTIVEACEAILSESMKKECHSSADAANLLIQAGVMAMFNQTEKLIDLLRSKIEDDNSFLSLADCVQCLSFLQGVEHILRIKQAEAIKQAKNRAINRIIPMIYSLTASDEKEDMHLAQSIKMLYQAADDSDIRQLYNEALTDLKERDTIPPTIDGAATGLLYNAGYISDALCHANAYLLSTDTMLALSGRFLQGIFLTARDIVFYDESFLKGINDTISAVVWEDFIGLLPDLRLAFTFFSPREIDQIGKKIPGILGMEQSEINLSELPQLSEPQLNLLRTIDHKAGEYMKKKGFV